MFSERKYYEAFKVVRNKFRKYRYLNIIGAALGYINAPAKDELELLQRQPWLVMLFIKWVLIDEQYPNSTGKTSTQKEVHTLLQLAYKTTSLLRRPNEYDHFSLFFKNISFQQFLYQTTFNYTHLSRQSILFSGLDRNNLIYKQFVEHTGLEVQDFLDLSLIILIRFLVNNETSISKEWFSTVTIYYSPQKIDCFLAAISKDINNIRNTLLSEDNGRRPSSEHYEVTPFLNFPLINENGKYILTHKNLLFRNLEYFVYDKLRSLDADKFMKQFGKLFERYVEKSLQHSEVKYRTEKQLKTLLGSQGNQIDFLIEEDSSHIYVDAKAVEMNSQGQTTHSTQILRDKTKQSILKAIIQAHDVIKKLSDNKDNDLSMSQINYLLVVTFKELYIGNGKNYYDAIAKEKIDEIYSTYSEYCVIPPENMFFITIDDLDVLTNIIKQTKHTFCDILEFAKDNDKQPETQKFIFKQHIESLGLCSKPSDYLIQEREHMLERIEQALKEEAKKLSKYY